MRKLLCGVLAFIICSFSIFSYAEETTNLQSEQQNLQNQINESNQNLQNVQNELSDNLQQIQQLDEKISNSEAEIAKTNEQIDELQKDVDEITEQMNIAQEAYNKQEKILEGRLVAMYEAGDTEYLDVLLSSSNISEFLSNYYLVSEIANYDTELLNDLSNKKDIINIAKEKLEEQRTQLAQKKQTEQTTATIIENVKILRSNYVANLSSKEKEIQAQIDEYTRKFADINSQISQLTRGTILTKYVGGQLAWPVPGYTTINSPYGMRTHPITGVYKLHTGVDIGAPMGADFVAANDGTVVKAEFNSAYGNMIVIDHGGGISTLYAHGSQILVTAGQTVTRNQPVLKVGSTGYSTGAHAHFEVRINGETTDPIPYITNGLIPGSQSSDNTNTTN